MTGWTAKAFVVSMIALLAGVGSAQATITGFSLVSPDGAPVEWRGTQNITWNATTIPGGSNNVSIVLSTDSGANYNKLVASPVDATLGTYSWSTSSTLVGALADGNTYRMRINDGVTGLDTSSVDFVVDNTSPTTSIGLVPSAPDGLNSWYVTTPTVTLTCADGAIGSGCLSGGTKYRWNGGSWNTYTVPFAALEGSNTLEWYSEDEAVDAVGIHNVETTHSQIITVDTTLPTVAITSTTSDGFYNAGDSINATLTFSEAVSSNAGLLVTFNTGGTCTVPAFSNQTAVSCAYAVSASENATDLDVSSLTGATVEDVAGNDSTLSPTANLAVTRAIVVDTTSPSAFTTGSVTVTGGTVVPLWWNSTNTGVNVVVPVANDTSLPGGTIQLRAEADGVFEDIGSAATILVGDLGGSRTIALTDAQLEALAGFSEVDVITFTAVITDNAGNATTGAVSATTFTVDQTAPSVNAGTDKEVNALTFQDATAGDLGSTIATYAWSQQAGAGVITFGTGSAEDTNVSANADSTYTLRLTVTDVAGNVAFDEAQFAWDTTAPTLAEVTAVPTPTNDTTPDYTFSVSSIKQLPASVGGGISYGGDCSSATLSAVAGNNTITLASLANGIYGACTIVVTDAAGNPSSALTLSSFKIDTVTALVTSITTTDVNADGKVETATVVFDDEVKDSSFTGATFTISGSAATFSTGTANDNTIILTVAGGVTGTDAKVVAYSAGSATDLAGNALSTFSQTSTDAAGPVLLSAITTSTTTATATFSEDLNGVTVNGSGSEFSVAGTTSSAASETGAGVVTLTYAPALGTGAEPLVTFTNSGTFTDLNGVEAPTPVSVTAVDGVAPLLSSIHIQSDNANAPAGTFAKTGDTVTITFTSSETIATPTVTIQGFAATVDAPSGNNWTVHRVMSVTDTEGAVGFSIAYADDALPVANTGITETTVDDSSSVLIDRTAPTVNAGVDREVNTAVAPQGAATSDAGSGVNTYAWTYVGPGTVTYSNPSGVGVGVDTDISADTDGTYTLTLTVTDNAGNSAFDTMVFIWDTTRPEPLTSAPSNGATNFAIANGTAVLTFDEPVTSLNSARIALVNDATNVSMTASASLSGSTLRMAYTGLTYGTKYRINVKPAAVTDVATNSLLSNFISYFTTQIDTIAPVVNSFTAGTITTTGAVLSVTTDENATCRYGATDSAFGGMTAFTTTGGTSHSVSLAGLTSSTAYSYYVRCQDASAQLNTMTVSAHVAFTTATPDTTGPVVSSVQATSITATGATIIWTTNELATSRIEYGTTSAYGAFTTADGVADLTSHSVALSGLISATEYHYRILSLDVLGNPTVSGDNTFTTLVVADATAPAIPAITTGDATIDADQYMIAGTIADDGGARTVLLYNGATLVGSVTVPAGQTSWSILTALNQVAGNVFTATATDVAGNASGASTSVTITEATTVGDTTAPAVPVITTGVATVDADQYTLTGTAGADLPADGTRVITITRSGTVVGSLSLPAGETDWSFTSPLLQGLPNSFSATSTDVAGYISAASSTVTIMEADTTAPVISSIQPVSIAQTTATIQWTTNESTTTTVEYGLTGSYGSTVTTSGSATSHAQGLTGLTAGTEYHYRVRSIDGVGIEAISDDATFTTSVSTLDTTAPIVSNIQAGAITTSGATITWATNEASDTQVEYGVTSSYGSTTTLNATAVTSHSQSLTGLATGTEYHFRVISKDATGISTTSGDNTFTTSAAAADGTAPTAPVITTTGTTINANTYTVSGTVTAESGSQTVTVYNGSTAVATVVVPMTQTSWSVVVSLTQNETNSFTAKSTDASDNISSVSNTVAIIEAEGAVSLAVTSIGATKTLATADDSYANGWEWEFMVTVPSTEASLSMKFDNFVSGANTLLAAGNMRFYSAQSSTPGTAISITSALNYAGPMVLTGDLDANTAGRQIKIVVQTKVPVSTVSGSYSTSYGIKSN
ncbi:MAG: hypothetical protein KBC02_03275 [Candidatus Pacebacteria bacterium]|nr:hypothetical protein [Candidatus Paceibacterota bacterium]